MHGALPATLILLAASVLAVVACRQLKLPALLGYLLVGIIIGPNALALLEDSADTAYLAEFGIVFLMFSIGLEFSLPKLKALRRAVFGLGLGQVVLTILLTLPLALLGKLSLPATVALGGILAMSSTAIVSTILNERLELTTPHGQQVIGVLLFQDIAVVPLLILIPALANPAGGVWQAMGLAAVKAAVVLTILLYFGPRILRPWFHVVAKQHSKELFIVNLLLFSLGTAYLTSLAGLSLALGAFLAGMLIAETEYRYQVEEDIQPFRDVLLGLFFVTVGMRLDISALGDNVPLLLTFLLILLPLKALLIFGISRAMGTTPATAWRTGLLLAQAGEFGFVLIALAHEHFLLPPTIEQPLLAAVLLSMLAAPFLIQKRDWLVRRFVSSEWLNESVALTQIAVQAMMTRNHVVICGYGRSGQNLARLLEQENIDFYALDLDPERVQEASAAGHNISFGDASKREVLMAAGLSRARAVVVTFADTHMAMRILSHVQSLRPGIPIIVRTLDETDVDKLREAGAVEVVSEVMEGSLMLASHTLMMLGTPLNRVLARIRQVREERYELFRGFFHGATDNPGDPNEQAQPRLHSVLITDTASAIGRKLDELQLDNLVEVKAIRRRHVRNLQLSPELEILSGDVLVLLGTPEELAKAEYRLLTG
ncbi:CPA2 family monovalent cation:H+ antiporter-2 [Chitinivorax tropicus]|uniref:CPA2 family monovalent cation:H+ antiporter-2 n=1 Tax=Chitinivorax tropicus TaxID=714531 RepID=A0A840MQW2_9PROT|nr:monovalent cation:proton antiporter family protein [Chitinivorax tropicus]MBB5019469.1 CPA2 family monovalent cation:H+ antiporter-2 [Chitinivorax tropicus]